MIYDRLCLSKCSRVALSVSSWDKDLYNSRKQSSPAAIRPLHTWISSAFICKMGHHRSYRFMSPAGTISKSRLTNDRMARLACPWDKRGVDEVLGHCSRFRSIRGLHLPGPRNVLLAG